MIGGMRRKSTADALTSPINAPIKRTNGTAYIACRSLPEAMPAERKADRVITFGIERSIAPPPVVMTSIWPSATIARKEAFELVAIKLSRFRLCAKRPSTTHIMKTPSAAQIHGILFAALKLSITDLESKLILHPCAKVGMPGSRSKAPLGLQSHSLSQV